MELYFVLTILDRAKARVMSGLHREADRLVSAVDGGHAGTDDGNGRSVV